MLGADFAATFATLTGSFVVALILAVIASLIAGMVLEVIAIRPLYGRGHLDQVLGTFGLILLFNELVRLVWGPEGRTLSAAARDADGGSDLARRPLPDLSPGYYSCDAGRCGAALRAGDAHPPRHAGPRRRVQPRDGRRARDQHQASLHAGIRAWRRLGRLCGRDASADPDGPDRHGREYSHSRLRGDHHRRHRLDPRRLCGRAHRRADRYGRACLFARHAASRSHKKLPRRRSGPPCRRCPSTC